MILYIGLVVMTVLLAFQTQKAGQPNTAYGVCPSRGQLLTRLWLCALFLPLFLVSAARYYVGHDYKSYVSILTDLANGTHVSTEPGFNALARICQWIFGEGEAAAIAVFAVMAGATVYFYLRAIYEQSEWFGYSFFLFMMLGYYFNSMTNVRYYFVLAVAMYAMKYAIQKRWLPFVLWICFAALFHMSVLFVIPVYFLAGLNLKWKKWYLIPAAVLCASFVIFREQYRSLIFTFYPFYENSAFDTGETSLINIVKAVCVCILALLYYRESVQKSDANRFYFFLNLASLALYLFCSFIPEISRIGFYLNASNIFLLPSVLKRIPQKGRRRFFTLAVAGAFLAYFILLLRGFSGEDIGLLPYRSWLFLY